jgi:pimeloyl-ACP methyl ester carboxylesterase
LITTPEGKLFVQSFGPDNGPPVLLIGGTASWSGFWASFAQRLGEAGYRAIAPDLPPFGFSDYPPDGDYSRKRQAGRLIDLIQAMAIERPIVLGHSYGGGPVIELALRRPDAIAGLVLVDAAVGLTDDGKAADAHDSTVEHLVRTPLVAQLAVDMTILNPLALRPLLAMSFSRKEAADNRQTAILELPQSRQGAARALAQWLPALVLPDRSGLSADIGRFTQLKLPVALIWGREDPLTPLEQAARLKQLVPEATLDVLPGVGHFPHVEDQSGLLRVLLPRLEAMVIARGTHGPAAQ